MSSETRKAHFLLVVLKKVDFEDQDEFDDMHILA